MSEPNQKGIIQKTAMEATVKKEPQTLKGLVQAMLPQISKALPNTITPERFMHIALTALSSTPKLNACAQASFLGALMQAAQLGLEPNTPLGQAYLIPYGNECHFQLGYKGLIDLAYRSGELKSLSAYCVYDNDEFEYELGLDPKLRHIPAKSERGKLAYVYAVYRLMNGGYGFEVMSVEDVNRHANQYGKSFKDSPWKTSFDEMAKKTVVKRALKYAPLKSEFLQGAAVDGAVINADEDTFELTATYSVDEETGEVVDDTAHDGGVQTSYAEEAEQTTLV